MVVCSNKFYNVMFRSTDEFNEEVLILCSWFHNCKPLYSCVLSKRTDFAVILCKNCNIRITILHIYSQTSSALNNLLDRPAVILDDLA